MFLIIQKILTITFLLFANQTVAQVMWSEIFTEPEKGIWGNESGNIITDFSGITKWSLDYSKVEVVNAEDYAKTVSTSGGRFEVRDVTGEVIWYSEAIDISNFSHVKIKLEANETGSGTNTENKYLKAFFRINGSEEIPFESNPENTGNWGSVISSQNNLEGEILQIVIKMANQYSGDKVILDEIFVEADVNYEKAESSDIVLNEILFNPVADGSDYVEIINVSDKLLSLKNLYMASRDKHSELTQIYPLAEVDLPFEPNKYLVLTKDTNGVFPWFDIQCFECFYQMEKFPSFNNDEDVVVLLNENMEIIDEFYYNEDMHSPFLFDVEGVSLERISVDAATNADGNWASASSLAGYGTPGYENSQTNVKNIMRPEITFEPEAFSPNNDGFNDEYKIKFKMNKQGFIASAKIFDASGSFIMNLAKNETLSTKGEIQWNGEDETGQKLPLGVYVVVLEMFHPDGEKYSYKDGIVLTDLLE